MSDCAALAAAVEAVVPLESAVVPLVVLRGSTAWKGGSTAHVGKFADRDGGEIGAEKDDFGGKIGWISWMIRGETWGNARST